MSDQISQDVLNSLAAEHSISQAELDALSLALAGKSMDEIAQMFGITSIAVRKRLGEVYRKCNIQGKGPGKLEALKRVLESKVRAISEPVETHQDWGDAPDVSIFYGRQQELAELKQWILGDNCRLVALVGMAGIGKTALAAKLATTIQSSFTRVYWRSLLYPPSIDDFLNQIIKFLSGDKDIELPENLNDRITLVMNYLRQQRCLLVIDSVETILRSDTVFGRYKTEYKDYGLLFKIIGGGRHQSCLFLCSQNKPKDIVVLENSNEYVQIKEMEGLELKDVQEWFKQAGLKNIPGNEILTVLTETVRGNPLNLLSRIIIPTKNLFNCDVKEFLNYTLNFTRTWIEDYDKIFQQLALEDITVIKYLAQQEEPISIIDLYKKLANKFSMNDLENSLESLEWRLLIKYKHPNSSTKLYCLDSMVKKYILNYYKK